MKLSESYSFHNPTSIIFGLGKIAALPQYVTASRVCLVTTPGFTRRGVTARIQNMFGERIVAVIDTIEPNPDLDTLDSLIEQIRSLNPDGVIALGGGSAIDSGKVIAKGATASGDWSLAKHFRQAQPVHQNAPLPCYVVPTTSGTGAEVTPFATVWDGKTSTKYSLANADMFPTAAILDPELTVDMPREVTLSTGLDAISQALESVWNVSCNDITLGWAISSLRLSLHALMTAANEPTNIAARTAMAQASLSAGLCISHTRTALAHSISYPLTAHYGLPHGFACSFTLPALFDFNREFDEGRLDYVGSALGYGDAIGLRNKVESVLAEADIWHHVMSYVKTPENLTKHVSEMITPNRSGNNLRSVNYDDIAVILNNSIQHSR